MILQTCLRQNLRKNFVRGRQMGAGRAWLENNGPSAPLNEGWELGAGIGLIGGFFVVLFGYSYGPPGMTEWAEEEARVRLERESQGLPVHYGKYYSSKISVTGDSYAKYNFQKNDTGELPTLADEEDN